MLNSEFYFWEDFDKDVSLFDSYVLEKGFKTVVGIAYGALPLLTCLKNRFPELSYKIVCAHSYKEKEKGTLVVEQFNPILWENPICLIDDIVDTGDTLKEVKDRLESWGKEVKTATLFYKKGALIKPDFFIHEVSDNKKWVYMPWELIDY